MGKVVRKLTSQLVKEMGGVQMGTGELQADAITERSTGGAIARMPSRREGAPKLSLRAGSC